MATITGTSMLIEATTDATRAQPLVGVSVVTEPAHGSTRAGGEEITYRSLDGQLP